MATLADLARQYLAQPLPDISGIFKPVADTPVEETPVEETVPGITPQLLQSTGGGDGYSVYNPDPTRTRTIKDYRFPFKFTGEDLPEAGDYITPPRTGIMGIYDKYKALPTGTKAALGATSLLTGGAIIPAALGVYGLGTTLEGMLPPNRRAILENELLGSGIMLDDIGRVVAGPGSINTAENIMAGYNAAKITKETFDKRRRMIEENMKDPVQKAAKLKALDEAEKIYLGADDRAYDIYENKLDLTLPTGITDTTFQNFLQFKNLTTPKRTGIETITDRETDSIVDTNAVEAAIAGAGGDTAAQRRQRIQDQRTIREANEAFRRGDDSAYSSGAAGIQRDSGGREVGYNDPFDPGGGE